MRTTILASLVSLSLAACASDGGSAPAISALTYSPMTATVGMQSTITGSVAFDDEDGDLARMHVEITAPNGMVTTIAPANISAIGDLTTGTLPFQMLFVPPNAGTWTFKLWISDDGDNNSNKLDGTVTVQ
jgi:hypothetical protein